MKHDDQPQELTLQRSLCVIGSTFICPYMTVITQEREHSVCLCSRHGDRRLKIVKQSITGGEMYPHPVYVGMRLRECQESPPVFCIEDPATSQSLAAIRETTKSRYTGEADAVDE